MKFLSKNIFLKINFISLLLILFLTPSSFADVRTQFIPTVSITEEYTDNYNQTQNNKDDEFSTIYAAGFSFGVIGKNASMFLDYNPGYTDHREYDENDSWSHEASFTGQMQMSEHTIFTLSDSFVRSLDRSVRTNSWEEHDTNTATAAISHEFGERDSIGVDYTYAFDHYDNSNADEYESHNPSASLSYWFTPQYGFDLNAAYEKTTFDVSTDEPETWSGDLRLLKSITRHFDIYISYAHTYTDQDSGDHTIYHPSIGFDWQPTEDSGISIGAGVLLRRWDDQSSEDSENFFTDFDIFKNFNFSRRGTFSLTGSSGYEETSGDAASLGFTISYEAGCLLSYELTKRLTAELDATYAISQYDDPVIGSDRQDNTLGLGAALSWSPLQWLSFNLSYSFIDFDTNDTAREDYQENVGMFTISMTPSQAVRFGEADSRQELEGRLFD